MMTRETRMTYLKQRLQIVFNVRWPRCAGASAPRQHALTVLRTLWSGRTFITCCLVLGLLVGCATTNADKFQGTWQVDVERTLAIDPQLRQLIRDDPTALDDFRNLKRIGWFRFQGGHVQVNDGTENIQRATYRVVSENETQLVIYSRSSRQTAPRKMVVTFLDDDRIEISIPDQNRRLELTRQRR